MADTTPKQPAPLPGADAPEIPDFVKELHPIAAQIVQQLGYDPALPEPYTMDPEVLAMLGPGIEQYIDDEDFELVMRTMEAVVDAFKNKLGSPTLASQIQLLLETPAIKRAWTDYRLQKDPEQVHTTAKQFAQFAHTDQVKKAPSEGAEKPKGAKSLDELGFPRRM